jgi:hypothetical protein
MSLLLANPGRNLLQGLGASDGVDTNTQNIDAGQVVQGDI